MLRFLNIVVLAPELIGSQIIELLKKCNSELNYYSAPSLVALEKYDATFLKKSRLISCASAEIVPKNILDKFGFGCINVHLGPPSLPGWQPAAFALYDAVLKYGITMHYMVEKVDAGEIIAIESFQLHKDHDYESLVSCLSAYAMRLLARLAHDLTQADRMAPLPIAWGPRKTTRELFRQYCQIDLLIEKNELERRVLAFGQGDGDSKLTLVADEQKYFLAKNQKARIGKYYKKIHGVLFYRAQT